MVMRNDPQQYPQLVHSCLVPREHPLYTDPEHCFACQQDQKIVLYHGQYDCGDFYCDSMHTYGIFTTRELAEKAWDTFVTEYKSKLGCPPIYDYTTDWEHSIAERRLNVVEEYGE